MGGREGGKGVQDRVCHQKARGPQQMLESQSQSQSQTALLAAALWWACDTAILRPVARRCFGYEWTDGYPRWRVALGCLTQLVWFPVMFLTFVLGGQAWLMECFLLVFACSLLQDCVRFPSTMGPLLLAHHAACLVGMLVARFAPGSEWGSVFPWFFGGCTALEFGSGFNNIFWLRWLPPRQSALLYLSTMTASNLVAVGCACAWVVPPLSSFAMRAFSLAAISVLVYHRQKETLRLCGEIIPHWLGRAGPSD